MLLRQRHDIEREEDEYAYEKSQRGHRRRQSERIEEAHTEAVIERERQLIPEEVAGAVALARTMEEAAAKREIAIKEAETRQQIVLEKTKLEIEKELISIRLEQRTKLDVLDLEKRWKETTQDLNSSTIFALQNLKKAEQIQIRLRDCYELRDRLKGVDTPAAKKERKLLKKHVKDLEKQFHATTGLLQGATQEDISGSNPNSQSPGDPR